VGNPACHTKGRTQTGGVPVQGTEEDSSWA